MMKKFNYFLAEDDGTNGGEITIPLPTDTETNENKPEQAEEGKSDKDTTEPKPSETPAYFSQFKKENREKFSSLSKYKSLDELADAVLKGEEKEEPNYEGYLKLPTKDSTTEELKEFMKKLGVPESSDKYTFKAKDDDTALVKAAEKTQKEASLRAGLTDSQAEAMWGVTNAVIDTQMKLLSEAEEKHKASFNERFDSLFKESYPDKNRREEAEKEAINRFSALMGETGLGKVFEETGAIYDERIVKGLSEFYQKMRGSYSLGEQKGNGSKSTTKFTYSDEFTKEFGGR